jgi:hypothetical protein
MVDCQFVIRLRDGKLIICNCELIVVTPEMEAADMRRE